MVGENFHVTRSLGSKGGLLDVCRACRSLREGEIGWVEFRQITKRSIDKRILEQVDIPSSVLFHIA